MIERLKSLSPQFLDSEGKRRLNPVKINFADVVSSLSKRDCVPDYASEYKLKPRFDIFFADLGYNIDQLSRVEGLSYFGKH